MTDRELLELAAKAAGLPVEMDVEGGIGWFAYGRDSDGNVERWWNPLKDDGDALRLAVALMLGIDHNHTADDDRYVTVNDAGGKILAVDEFEDDSRRNESTRRVIVRAAAEIGRAALSQSE